MKDKKILQYMRKRHLKKVSIADNNNEIFIANGNNEKYVKLMEGFDATTEFQPRSLEHYCPEINSKVNRIRKDFSGKIYDYEDLVLNKRYNTNFDKKCYPAIMPMWDNTARRNHRGTIFKGSTPLLYKKWLKEILDNLDRNKKLDENL